MFDTMKKKLLLIFAVAMSVQLAAFSQSADFYGVVSLGGNVAVGNFGKATVDRLQLKEWGLADDTPFGGAGIGANASLFGAKRVRGIEELSIFVSADFFFSALNKNLRDYNEQYEVENLNTHDKYEHTFPVFLDIPLFAGCRYDFYTNKRELSFFGQAGIGANLHIITDFTQYWNMYKHSSEAYSYKEEYRKKISFAATAGAGVVLFEHIQIGIHYHYLGTYRVISTSEEKIDAPSGLSITDNKAHSRGLLSPHILSLRVGYLF